MNLRIAFLGLAIAAASFWGLSAQTPLYKNPSASPEERTEDLISRMTLEEKVAQLTGIWNTRMTLYTDGQLDWDKFDERFKNGIGQWARMSEDKSSYASMLNSYTARESAELYNTVQRRLIENTRLGIPMMVHEEGLHGHQSFGSTHFPIPLGLASSWDEDLFGEVYTIVAREIRAKGGHEVLAPVVDVTRDPRWGRTEETMGEDPYLNGRLGVAQVKAYQGTPDPEGRIDSEHVGATLKHFGVHGQSEGGSNTGPSFVDEIYAFETFFRPFKMCIEEANPYNIMISYNEIWGKTAHSSRKLVTQYLREKLGFKGLIVSDYGGAEDAMTVGQVPNEKEAAYAAFKAGVEIELPEGVTYVNLPELVEEGRISMDEIDAAVRHILLEKFRLGLFDNPYLDPDKSEKTVGNDEAKAVAYKAATESLILLQNRDDVLPFDENKIKTIAVIGPNAKDSHLGGYSNTSKQAVTPLQAIQERYGDKMEILYAEGCKITMKGDKNTLVVPSYIPDSYLDLSVEASEEVNRPLIEEAVRIASKADAVILCLGSNESIAREGTGTYLPGDTPTLELLGGQNELAERIAELGKPTCALIITGTTNNVSKVAETTPGVMMCFYPGQEGGYAMIDAVFGKVNPSGKLTISIPRSAGHVPAYYAYKRQSRRGYTLMNPISPLYPFGFGLSYTTFSYSDFRLSSDTMTPDGHVEAIVKVTNTGKVPGDEIVQLYIKDDLSSLSRPVKELKGFSRIHLEAGQSKEVRIPIDRSSLEFYNENLDLIVEEGTFTVMVGPSSNNLQSLTLTVK